MQTTKVNTLGSKLRRGAVFLHGLSILLSNLVASAFGRSSLVAKPAAIQVGRCEYAATGAYVELLISARSSTPGARLLAYLPDGTYLGEVLNGGGETASGTVFVLAEIPGSITLRSSAGGSVIVPCVPYQP